MVLGMKGLIMNIDLSEHWVMPASSKLIWVIAAVAWMFNTPIGGLILLGFLGLIFVLDDIQAKYFDMIEKNKTDDVTYCNTGL